ncbi:MAG: Rieske 2Fe-2S domain-containing protein [Chloroflexota bacterium]
MSQAAVPLAAIPSGLHAPGSQKAPWFRLVPTTDLAAGSMIRVTIGDLDVLVAYTPGGLVAVDDRCPHMAAPLSLGVLDGCVVACPLHAGRFDLSTGTAVQMPTTGGLGPDGTYYPTWTPGGREAKPDVPGTKAEARRLTRIRRMRYYPLQIVDGWLEARIPGHEGGAPGGT